VIQMRLCLGEALDQLCSGHLGVCQSHAALNGASRGETLLQASAEVLHHAAHSSDGDGVNRPKPRWNRRLEMYGVQTAPSSTAEAGRFDLLMQVARSQA
jgi:hypothetical protein